MKIKSLALTITTLGVLEACGNQAEKQASEGTPLSASEVMGSNLVQSELLSENSMETTDQLSDLSEPTTSFGLDGGSSMRDHAKEKTRTCTEAADSNSITVGIERSVESSKTSLKKSRDVSFSESITRVWNHPSIDLKCKELHLDFEQILGNELGLKRDVTFKKERSMNFETKKRSISRTMSKTGTRSVEYTANIGSEDTNGYRLHSLKVNSSSAKSVSISKDGKDRSISIKNTIVDLLVDVNRGEGGWDYKIINSGSLVSTVEGGVEMKLDYNKVKFVKSEEKDSCRPVSGSIKGSIKGSTSSKELTVEFGETETVIKVDGVVDNDLDMDFSGCDFGKMTP